MTTRARRVYHAEVPGPGAEIPLGAGETHHVRRVLRLKPGDPLSVFDGGGREWRAELLGGDQDCARVRIGDELTDRVEPELAVHLFQALCRPDRMDWLVQKGTEIGLSAIHPVLTSRVETPTASPQRLERWRRIAREACKQCGRRHVPPIDEPVKLPPPPSGVLGLALDASPQSRPLGSYLERRPPQEVWLAAGPEGGFGAEEAVALRENGWLPAALGPRTLRTETAGVVAGAIVLHVWGDLGGCRNASPFER